MLAILSVVNEMFIRCGFEGDAGGAGAPGEGCDKH